MSIKPTVILVGGSSASGKTKFKMELKAVAEGVTVIAESLDCGYRDLTPQELANVSQHNFDDPRSFDWPLLVQTARDILRKIELAKVGDTIEYRLPCYDFATHKRVGETIRKITIEHERVAIILEGIFALHNADLLDMADVKIFIDADQKTRILRRIIRDLLHRDRDILSIAYQILQFVEPAYEKTVGRTRANASLIVNNHITAKEVEKLMETLKRSGCEKFEPIEMKKHVAGKEETFGDGTGEQFSEAIQLIARFISKA